MVGKVTLMERIWQLQGFSERSSNERRSERRSQLANDCLNGVQYFGNERCYERRSKNQRTHHRTAVLWYNLPHMADKHIHCINFLYFFKLKKLYFPTAPNSNVIDPTNADTLVLLQVFFYDVIDTTLGHSIFL